MDTTVLEKGNSMKRSIFKVPTSETYVMVYQRADLVPRFDFNFFDGPRSLSEAREQLEILTKALGEAERWSKKSR